MDEVTVLRENWEPRVNGKTLETGQECLPSRPCRLDFVATSGFHDPKRQRLVNRQCEHHSHRYYPNAVISQPFGSTLGEEFLSLVHGGSPYVITKNTLLSQVFSGPTVAPPRSGSLSTLVTSRIQALSSNRW